MISRSVTKCENKMPYPFPNNVRLTLKLQEVLRLVVVLEITYVSNYKE